MKKLFLILALSLSQIVYAGADGDGEFENIVQHMTPITLKVNTLDPKENNLTIGVHEIWSSISTLKASHFSKICYYNSNQKKCNAFREKQLVSAPASYYESETGLGYSYILLTHERLYFGYRSNFMENTLILDAWIPTREFFQATENHLKRQIFLYEIMLSQAKPLVDQLFEQPLDMSLNDKIESLSFSLKRLYDNYSSLKIGLVDKEPDSNYLRILNVYDPFSLVSLLEERPTTDQVTYYLARNQRENIWFKYVQKKYPHLVDTQENRAFYARLKLLQAECEIYTPESELALKCQERFKNHFVDVPTDSLFIINQNTEGLVTFGYNQAKKYYDSISK